MKKTTFEVVFAEVYNVNVKVAKLKLGSKRSESVGCSQKHYDCDTCCTSQNHSQA